MARHQLSRKLAVILHADVVGSTSLVQKDEVLAHQRMQSAFHHFAETIQSYGGTAREIRGDALVAEFERASDAVSASLAYQILNAELNAIFDDELKPWLRIGISLGEVVIANNTITGSGVVLAQRLEQLAESGGVVVQGTVSETVPGRMPFDFESLGEQTLKGFEKPVRAFGVKLLPGQSVPEPDSKPSSSLVSIAILPFQNMSADPEQEYFVDGITEDIITELSRIPALLVISRNSTFTYKGKVAKAQDVCRDLGVRYMLEGSIRKSGQQVRITAQLIDGISGGHLWAERYDRDLSDIFAVQDDVTEKIVAALEINLVSGLELLPTRSETNSPEAYDFVLRGREQYQLFSKQSNINAAGLFEQAIEIDPNYAAAYAGLALTGLHEWFQGIADALERAYELAVKAHGLDSSLPLALEALGNVSLFRRQYDEGAAAARRWLEIEPGNADAYANMAAALIVRGEPSQVISLLDKAIRLNPFYPFYYVLYEGLAYQQMGNDEKALNAIRRSVVHNPQALHPHIHLAASLGISGMEDQAREALDEARKIVPDISISWIRTYIPYLRAIDLSRMLEGLRVAGLEN